MGPGSTYVIYYVFFINDPTDPAGPFTPIDARGDRPKVSVAEDRPAPAHRVPGGREPGRVAR
jgi:hypothetical protein